MQQDRMVMGLSLHQRRDVPEAHEGQAGDH